MSYGDGTYGGEPYGGTSGTGGVPPAPQTVTLDSIDTGDAVGAPIVATLQVIAVGSVPDQPAVGAPLVLLPGAPAPAARLRVYLADRNSPTVPVLELDESFGRQWLDALNDAGTASLALGLDDPDAAGVDYFDVLRFELDELVRFASVVERKRAVAVSREEDAGEVLEVSGRGIVALLEDAVVYPELGPDVRPFADARRFDFTSGDFDDSGWGYSNALAFTTMGGPLLEVDTIDEPEAWPDHEAYKIWPFTPDWPVTPPGVAYFRRWVEIPADGIYRIFATADDGLELYVDSIPVIGDVRPFMWKETTEVDVFFSAGWHLLAVKATNLDVALPADNLAWVVVTLYSLRESSAIAEVIVHTDSTWRGVFEPPATPGFTPGKIVRLIVEEAQARGFLAGVTLGFTDTADTAGAGWPTTADVAFPHGLDLLSALKQLAETYFDFELGPDLVLRLWTTRGTTSAVAYEEGSNLVELIHEGQV